jgi:hypothetical protein
MGLSVYAGIALLLEPYFNGEKEFSWRKGYSWFMVFVFVSFNIGFLLGKFSAYYNHFKLLTYGGIVVLLLLLVSRGAAEENSSSE